MILTLEIWLKISCLENGNGKWFAKMNTRQEDCAFESHIGCSKMSTCRIKVNLIYLPLENGCLHESTFNLGRFIVGY